MLQPGDLVVGEPVTLEVPSTGKRYRVTTRYLDRNFVYLSMPQEDGQPVELEPDTPVRLIVIGFGSVYVYTTRVYDIDYEQSPPRLMVRRTGPPEKQESRQNLRLTVQIPATVQLLGADGSVVATKKGEMLDVSAGGGRLRMAETLAKDQELHLRFPLQGSPEGVEVNAKVARVFPVIRRGQHEFGLMFTGEKAEAMGDRIVKWILDQQRRRAAR